MQARKKNLTDIFMAGVRCVEPAALIRSSLFLEKQNLCIQTPAVEKNIDLSGFKRIYVLGFGKATAPMAAAVEDILGERIDDGCIVVKYGHTRKLSRIRLMEAAHPVPDDAGIRAAIQIEKLARKADAETLVITLISGGGSALIPSPPAEREAGGITLAEKQAVTGILLDCGAAIDEINCLRKHLSQIKGGRLAGMIYPATSLNLILSDVVGDSFDTIASGPTAPDETSFDDVARIVEKYDIRKRLPKSVEQLFQRGAAGRVADTPGKNDPIFKSVSNILIGTNYLSLLASRDSAQRMGYQTTILSSRITGEAREVAKMYCGIAIDAGRYGFLGDVPVCIIAGGETTVTLRGTGKGGRNQEMALSFLAEIGQDRKASQGIYFLAASTDGNDGPTDAAGAFACGELLDLAVKRGLDVNAYLKNNDAYHFFEGIGGLLKTGPTNTNVCDIQIIFVERNCKKTNR